VGIEAFVPRPLVNPYRRLRSSLKNRAFGKTNTDIFDEIYRCGAWGSSAGAELYSGPGTYDQSVETYVELVLELIDRLHVRSITEIGVGDFAIASRYAGKVEQYVGVDVSSRVVDTNSRRFGTDTIRFVHGDASKADLPASDLCIIRQVLQHLDNQAILGILDKAKVHRRLLITEHLPGADRLERANLDKRTGPDTRLAFGSGVYVELPPFNRDVETVLTTPVSVARSQAGEILRTTLIENR
jgi:hypothetical protein